MMIKGDDIRYRKYKLWHDVNTFVSQIIPINTQAGFLIKIDEAMFHMSLKYFFAAF